MGGGFILMPYPCVGPWPSGDYLGVPTLQGYPGPKITQPKVKYEKISLFIFNVTKIWVRTLFQKQVTLKVANQRIWLSDHFTTPPPPKKKKKQKKK